MSEVTETTEALTKPFFDQAVWGAIPSIISIFAVIGLLYWLRDELKQVLSALIVRLKSGASIKLAGLEIGPSSGLVASSGDFSAADNRVGIFLDDGTREKARSGIYKQAHGVMLVHRLQRSEEEGQQYDALIYVIPHKSTSFAGVSSVEYYFGRFWGNKVFPSTDRSRGFPVFASAYGPFLCTAKVNFTDGTHTTLSRYIDFEMSSYAPPRA